MASMWATASRAAFSSPSPKRRSRRIRPRSRPRHSCSRSAPTDTSVVKLFRRATFGDEVSAVDGGIIRLRGGAPRVIVGTSSLNFEGLAPEQQARSTQAFRDLLHAQSGPLQLYLRIRRVAAEDAAEPEAAGFADHRASLPALPRSFINAHLQDTPVYQREIFVVLGGVEPARQLLRSWLFRFDRTNDQPRFVGADLGTSLRNRARALSESLRRIGLKAHVLDDP